MDGVSFNVDFSDLKPSVVARLLRESVSREMSRTRMASKKEESDDSEDEDEESESDKLVKLQEDSKGKPSPIPVSANDFSKDTVRKVMGKMPPMKSKKSPKA
jgi:hypothetical protein